MHGVGILRVVGDQQHRFARPPPPESAPPTVPRRSWRRMRTGRSMRDGAGGDAPIAGGGVVHGIGEACRRNLAASQRQRLADFVAIVAVAAGRGEHARQLARARAGARGRFRARPRARASRRGRCAAARSAGSSEGTGSTVGAGRRLAARQHGGRVAASYRVPGPSTPMPST